MSEEELHFGRDVVLDPSLLPEYANWLSFNPGSGIAAFVRPELKPEHFFAVASILTPAIIRYQKCLFLSDGFDPSRYQSWIKQVNGNLTSVERVMNHRHVRNIAQSLREAPFPLILGMGQLIKCALESWLRHVYPDITTLVQTSRANDDVEVTFFVVRSKTIESAERK